MELFTIQCTTCRARLKVKDESAIGIILACPKCSSMVQVVPPVGWQRGTAAVPSDPLAGNSSITIGPPASRPQAAKTAAAVAATAEVAVPAAPPVVTAPVATASGLSRLWQVLAARAKQDWVLLGGGVAAGVTIGVCAWMLTFWNSPTASIATPEATAEVALAPVVDVKEPIEPAAAIGVEPEPSSPAPIAKPAEVPAETVEAESRSQDPLAAISADPPSDPPVSDNKSEEPAPIAPAATESALKLEPVDKSKAASVEPLADREDPTTASAAEAVAFEEPPSVRPMPTQPAAEKPGARSISRSEIDGRLSTAIPTVQFAKVPLAQFVEFIADFSALPIAIDDAALAKIGKSRQSPVTVKLSQTTAADALHSALRPLGLTCVVANDRLLVTAKPRAK